MDIEINYYYFFFIYIKRFRINWTKTIKNLWILRFGPKLRYTCEIDPLK